jgi:predicted adenine nucleotide alpha hydrolase (AANH) superfamily ATPase
LSKYSTLKPGMLLHVCCANCAAYPVLLLENDFDITFFYYNPNIYPEEEYYKRLKDVQKLAGLSDIPLLVGQYEDKKWFEKTKHLAGEPEGGKRCRLCFYLRLKETARTALKGGFNIFATTLSVSPHKNSRAINEVGTLISKKSGIDFYVSDLKKKDGFKKTTELSYKYNFYRQNYCGCIYSIRNFK